MRVGLGLNRNGNSSAVLSASSSPTTNIAPQQSNVATVEPQQVDPLSKTLEQRRMEAREILLRERQRQLQASPSRKYIFFF